MARTHCSINAFILSCIAVLAIGAVTACENTARGLKEDASKAEVETRDERAQAKETAKELGAQAGAAASRAAGAAAIAGEALAERAGALKETVDVKTALMADASVDASRIDVDTDSRTRTITLNGYAPNAGERDKAEVIAKAHADGFKVVNNITVSPR
ncbi:MAG TPA: BON domain-containing protein [Vicinamibacterales bacterium]|nr:BON domain-containing protein [Vicinamibacterales bacterium]